MRRSAVIMLAGVLSVFADNSAFGQVLWDMKRDLAENAKSEGYQEAGAFLGTPGYSDKALSADTHLIDGIGHAFTPEARMEHIAMARAGELAVRKGFSHFSVVERRRTQRCMQSRIGGAAVGAAGPVSPTVTLRVRFAKSKIGAGYLDAREQFSSRVAAIKNSRPTPAQRLAAYASYEAACNGARPSN